MNQTLSEALFMIVSALAFALAITGLVYGLTRINNANNAYAESINSKASINTTKENEYSEEYLTCKGSDVLAMICDADMSINVYLDGVHLDEDYLERLKRKNPDNINDLKAHISIAADYRKSYEYDTENNLTAIYYTRE